MKSNLLYIAMALLILSLPIYSSENQIIWLWKDILWIPFICVSSALVLIGFYLYKLRNSNSEA